ncbi:MAG: hypothetical protein J6K17_08005 [Oscillospiraceae bacterium]|nr:hypothetical protein [Oscillospiraceae bacterium]
MKKTLIVLMCTAMLFTCGCSEKATMKSVEGKYVSLGFDLSGDDYGYDFADDELDDFLEETIDGDETYILELADGEFETENALLDLCTSGKFELDEDGKFEFDYEELNGVDIDTKDPTFREKTQIKHMEEWNDKNNYLFGLGSFGMTANGDIFPFTLYVPALNVYNTSALNGNLQDGISVLAKGDFLCRNVSGTKLVDDYKQGKDFSISYNYVDTFEKDETSYVKPYMENQEQQLDMLQSTLRNIMDIDGELRRDFDTTIEFEDGEWEWLNKEGVLLNNGEYQESEKYKGLIVMYITDDSENYLKREKSTVKSQRIFLYIHDGEIYAPVFIKTDE